jgi:bifunctional non-homologous end joining protein LigD
MLRSAKQQAQRHEGVGREHGSDQREVRSANQKGAALADSDFVGGAAAIWKGAIFSRTVAGLRDDKHIQWPSQTQTMAKGSQLDVGGRTVNVTNLDKVLYPETGFTKGDLINYYIRISPVLLPHLKDRPITLKRYPDGVDGFYFYEKKCPSHRPKWVKTTRVAKSEGGEINYCLINDLPALVWAANLADLELHTFLHKATAIARPTTLAFDLDPGPPADIVLCCQVGLHLKAIFDALGMESFAKTSGSKGLQVYVPLDTPVTYKRTKAFAHALAQLLERQFPETVVSKMQKSLRRGKVLVDWSQNDDHKTTINVYSLRAKKRPSVSTPVTWDEVSETLKRKDSTILDFEYDSVLERVKKLGDLFSPVLELKQKLPRLDALNRLSNVGAKDAVR